MDKTTFEQTMERLRPLILRIGQDFFGSMDDAEDVAQETLIRLWQYCQRLDEGRNIEALVMRMAKHCCVDMQRRSRIETIREDDDGPVTILSLAPSPHDELEQKEGVTALNEAISTLKPRERQLFEMRQQEGLSTEEIAEQTGIPRASVQSMISMARKKVFNELRRRMNR